MLPLKVVDWENDYLNYKHFSGKFNTIIKTTGQFFTIISLEGYADGARHFFERVGKRVKATK
ncbi:hypothetical protein [Wolbachia endosymbiont of Brugia malayi]|uniref:hypothetical protein n=1 Tax=Wolbachia endosymbiont of Brugia malayi TaxID=80849 RepID=UPI0002FB193B|nr:hypothetical protein [Wolbachia endosymbiont of Brugia malayi]